MLDHIPRRRLHRDRAYAINKYTLVEEMNGIIYLGIPMGNQQFMEAALREFQREVETDSCCLMTALEGEQTIG